MISMWAFAGDDEKPFLEPIYKQVLSYPSLTDTLLMRERWGREGSLLGTSPLSSCSLSRYDPIKRMSANSILILMVSLTHHPDSQLRPLAASAHLRANSRGTSWKDPPLRRETHLALACAEGEEDEPYRPSDRYSFALTGRETHGWRDRGNLAK